MRAVLTEFAMSRQRVVLSPRLRAVLGLVVAERERFPDLAQIYTGNAVRTRVSGCWRRISKP